MSSTVSHPIEGQASLAPDEVFPFRRELSLAPLVTAWIQAADREEGLAGSIAAVVRDRLREVPELMGSVADPALFARQAELIDVLMAKVFPAASWDRDYGAVLAPFTMRAVYATPSFTRLFLGARGTLQGHLSLDPESLATGRLLRAYGLILEKYYDVDLSIDYPLIVTAADPDCSLPRHFRFDLDARFLEVDTVGRPPVLSAADRQRLLANLGKPHVLTELIPPDRFVFRGFGVVKATDVTDQEVLSSLKRDLIEKESIASASRFERLQLQLRTFFRRPDLCVTLAAFQGERVLVLKYGARLEHCCIFADSVHLKRRDFAGTIFERASQQDTPFVIDDLGAYAPRGPIEDGLLKSGMRNIVLAPLHYQDAIIGLLELSSPHPGDLDAVTALKLREVLPLFSMAMRRSLEELEARVQAVVKEKCTAIHPSVEWRFRQAVLNTIERRADGSVPEMEPIVFRDVYPLYGASDIRGSSTQRNLTIQADLTTHLGLARAVIREAREAKHLPILDEVAFRIDRQLTHIGTDLHSGDEVTILAFLRQHVEPLFEHVAGFGPAVRERVEAYRAAVDPQVGSVYRRRKDYEDTVTAINEAVSAYLDAEQEMAQAMFPHYFEKQRTDGVDYSIYVGGALVDGQPYNELYLRNLRLWQLLVACGIARQTEALRQRLPLPLETTHLILAHHAPLSIRFRFDEKRFDVDGAYNVRYEVVKKRIDKAVVRGTGERVTQPGRIAIVYAQPTEAQEYREYLDYLLATGHLVGPVEELELDELQGVHGLRALRVAVDLSATRVPTRSAIEEAVLR
jgi:GAF domain-containing protein